MEESLFWCEDDVSLGKDKDLCTPVQARRLEASPTHYAFHSSQPDGHHWIHSRGTMLMFLWSGNPTGPFFLFVFFLSSQGWLILALHLLSECYHLFWPVYARRSVHASIYVVLFVHIWKYVTFFIISLCGGGLSYYVLSCVFYTQPQSNSWGYQWPSLLREHQIYLAPSPMSARLQDLSHLRAMAWESVTELT